MGRVHASTLLKAVCVSELVIVVAHEELVEVKSLLEVGDRHDIGVIGCSVDKGHALEVRNSHGVESIEISSSLSIDRGISVGLVIIVKNIDNSEWCKNQQKSKNQKGYDFARFCV